jgi:hypothetical protein
MMPGPASAARRHRRGDRQVRGLLPGVAGDRVRCDTALAQQVVEQHPGARTALAVDVADAGVGEVLDPAEAEGVAGSDEQPLLAVHEADHGYVARACRVRACRAGAEHAVQVGQRVLAGRRVEQVRAGEVAQAVPHRYQAAEGPDVG